jgi:hypothetical protein
LGEDHIFNIEHLEENPTITHTCKCKGGCAVPGTATGTGTVTGTVTGTGTPTGTVTATDTTNSNKESRPYLTITGDVHQGMWMLTRQQIKYLQEKCQFLEQRSQYREYMSSYSIYDIGVNPGIEGSDNSTNPGTNISADSIPGYEPTQSHCGMRKLIPGSTFDSFVVYHYYPSRDSDKDNNPTSLFNIQQRIRIGE